MDETESDPNKSKQDTEIALDDAAALSLLAAYPDFDEDQYQQILAPIKAGIARDIAEVLRSDAMGRPIPRVRRRALDAARELRKSVLAYSW